MLWLLLLQRQVRPGLGCSTDLLSDPEPSRESAFHLACTVLLMLNVMNMGLIIKPLVLDGIAILTAFEEYAIGHEDQALNISTVLSMSTQLGVSQWC